MAASDQLSRALNAFDAGSFVRRHSGYKESLSPRSFEYLLTCPCGSDRLRWNARKHTWICWGHPSYDLNRSGDTIKLICILEGIEEIDAIEYVLRGYVGGDSNFESLESTLSEDSTKAVRLLPAIPWPAGVDKLIEPCEPHKQAWEYLARRGITAEQIQAYGLGIGRMGKLHGYVVFPVWMDGSFVFYQGRCTWDPPLNLTPEIRREWVARMGYRKTLNPVSVGRNATGSEVIFNYDRACSVEQVIVCEGPVDAIKCGPTAVALLGKVAQKPKVERLKRMSAKRFVIYLDRGKEEAECAAFLAKELSPYAEIKIAVPPEGHDAGSLTLEQNARICGTASRFEGDKLRSELR